MKTYTSSQSLLFVPILWLVVLLIISSFFITENDAGESVPPGLRIFLSLIGGLVIWILIDTKYKIKDKSLNYYSGPIRGKIDIYQIRKIEHVKTFFVSSIVKPALGSHGLTVTYNKFDDIYISPKNKEAFIGELLKINPDIEIIN
nr:PH domain-containing protein [uncultured Flavobacterium sp.]